MKKFSVTIIVLLLSIVSFGQANRFGIPFILNYDAKTYNGSYQNWSAIQDKRGVMYFGNNDAGVLEYDGNSWRQILVPNNSTIRSMAIDDDGIIYVGAVNEIGYLTADIEGKLYFKSLLDLLDTNYREFGDVYKIYCHNRNVYFCSFKQIIKYSPPGSINVIKLSKDSFFSYLINDKIYTSNYPNGLKELGNDSLVPSPNGNYFAKTDIMTILPYQGDWFLLFVRPDESKIPAGIYFYNHITGEILDFQKNKFSSFLNENLVQGALYQATKLISNDYVFATLGKGCFITDEKGELISLLNKRSGLKDETVIFSYNNSDDQRYQPLWLTLNNGISKVETYSSINRFGEESGLSGIVMDIVRFEGILYVATNIAIYYLDFDINQTPYFKQVKDIDGAWSFLTFELSDGSKKLLAGSPSKICEIKKGAAYPTDKEFHSCFKLANSETNPNSIYVAMQNGFKVINFVGNKWIGVEKNKDINAEIRFVSEDNEGNVWLASNIDGIIKIDKSLKIKYYKNEEGLPESLKNFKIFKLNKKLYFATPKGLYKYDKDLDKFTPDISLGKRYADGSRGIFCMGIDNKGGVWLNLSDTKDRFWTEHLIPNGENGYIVDSLPFKRIPEKLSVNSFYQDPDYPEIVWLATGGGVFSYNQKIIRNYDQKFNTLIRNVTIGNDSVVFYGTYFKKADSSRIEVSLLQPDELKPVIEYKNNKISFSYAAPFFEEESLIEYSRFLEGFDEGWSKWSKENKTPYTNLPEGKYKFRVKAKNIYGIEGNEAVYEFEILPPWYRTIWAYISYALIAILIVWGIVKLATRRMKQLNIAYGRYLPGAFLKLLEKRRVIDFKLGDMTEKEMTIMFSDIRSYTNLSETMSPSDNFRFQVKYLSMIGIELNKNHGFPVQYYGDGIVAMFPGDSDTAVMAAIDMHKRVEQYSLERKAKKRRGIKIGIGMHTGKIIMGIRGDKWRWEGGIVGDSVNLAARMEGLTKIFGTSTLMSDDTYNKLKNKERFNIRFLGRVKVKGKDVPVGLYEILDGLPQEEAQLKSSTKNAFDAALNTYYSKDFKKALEMFNNIIKINDIDFTAHHYIDLCKLFIKEGVTDDWDGVEKLDKK